MTLPDHVATTSGQRPEPQRQSRGRRWLAVIIVVSGIALITLSGWALWQGPPPRTITVRWTDCHPRPAPWQLQPGEVLEDCTETRLNGDYLTSATIHRVDGRNTEGSTEQVPNPDATRFAWLGWPRVGSIVEGSFFVIFGWLFGFRSSGRRRQ
jgi:hypothetical protein